MIRALILVIFFSGVAYGQQQMLLRGDAAAPAGILDGYTADAAYCTCWLYSAYSGSLLRVRRSSDQAEQDIGRDGQGLDEAALTSFCSGASCFVVTWYDQSGSGLNASRAGAAGQPKIYDSGTGVIRLNGIAAIQTDGIGQYLNVGDFFSGGALLNAFSVVDLDATGNQDVYNKGIGAVGEREYSFVQSLAMFVFDENTDSSVASGGSLSLDRSLFYSGYNTTSFYGRNGAALTQASLGAVVVRDRTSTLSIMGSATASRSANGKIQAQVFYSSDQSANRAAIETRLNNYFSIY